MTEVNLRLTPLQARILWNIIDGAADAGACADGLTAEESEACHQITMKLLKHHDKWKISRPPAARPSQDEEA